MNCHQVTKVISAYIDGELTGREMLAVRHHVSYCETCAEEMESIRGAKLILSRLRTVQPKAGFADQILANLGHSRPGAYQRFVSALDYNVRKRLSPVAAALAVAGLAMVALTPRGTGWPVPNMNQSTLVAKSPFAARVAVQDAFGGLKNGMVEAFPQEPLRVSEKSEIGYSVSLASFGYR